MLFLPQSPVFYQPLHKSYDFYKIDLVKLFFKKGQTGKPKVVFSLKGITLKSVYYDGKNGFVIISDKNRDVFVDLNSSYKGYKLIKINRYSALFTKNGKNYKIQFDNSKIESNFFSNMAETETPPKIAIQRKVFESYKNNILKIWTNIGIIKTKEGYMITYLKPKSIFQKIGLRRGDVILEVNGRKLKNDLDAWNLYRNADKFKTFEITILRNHKKKVLYYEVN
jgi:general secretion pathway protein C